MLLKENSCEYVPTVNVYPENFDIDKMLSKKYEYGENACQIPVCLDSKELSLNYSLYKESQTTPKCLFRNKDYTTILPCPGSFPFTYCHITANYTGVCQSFLFDQLLEEALPDEKCDEKNYDITLRKCVYGKKICQGDLCLAQLEGNACSSTKDCSRDLICNSIYNYCEKAVEIDGDCNVDADCGRQRKCLWNSAEQLYGKCKELYSLPDDESVAGYLKGGSIMNIKEGIDD